jgi:hypothetical protein
MMKRALAAAFRFILSGFLVLSLSCIAHAQHGGGGHGAGGHGGHFGGGHHAGRSAGTPKAHGLTHHAPFSAVRLFGRHRHPHFAEPYFFANGLLLGDFINCGLWDWSCGLGWDDGYFAAGGGMYATPDAGAAGSDASGASPTVTVLYLKNGYSVGVTEYYLENGKLHYLTTYGGEDEVPIDDVDLQRTVNENASMGVPFVLHPKQAPVNPQDH